MKNIFKLLPLLLLLFSCEQGIIFHDIALEIKLEEPNVLGNINSIVKLGGNLYVQNGNIYTKSVGIIRGWEKIAKPGRVIALASDADNLYALTATQTAEDNDSYTHTYQVYVLIDGKGDWATVPGAAITTVTEDGVNPENVIALFDNSVGNGTDDTTNRRAYVRIDDTVSLLNGGTLGATQTGNGITTISIAAARLTAGDYFSDSRSFCSNGTNRLYRVNNSTVEYSTDSGANWEESSVEITEATTLIFADDRLYVGTSLGIEEIILGTVETEDNIPISKDNLPSNAEATTGEKEITALGYFADAIYAGAIEQYSTMNNGLWGYYESRGNWNFE